MVATNALGMRVDIPDIRVMIHAGAPRKLRDYAQESGRAGRDRLPSKAIIVCSTCKGERGRCDSQHRFDPFMADIPEFMDGQSCPRVVIDRVMDGKDGRVRCEEGEEACDVCNQDRQMLEALQEARWVAEDDPLDDSGGVVPHSQVSRPEDMQLRAEFEQQEQSRPSQRTQGNEKRQEAIEVSEFRQQLNQWLIDAHYAICRGTESSNID